MKFNASIFGRYTIYTIFCGCQTKCCRKDLRRWPGFDLITFSENSKYWRESLLEVIRQNIARRCQQTVEKQKNCWHHQAMFCLYTSRKISRPYSEFSLKVIGSNPDYLLKKILLYYFFFHAEQMNENKILFLKYVLHRLIFILRLWHTAFSHLVWLTNEIE